MELKSYKLLVFEKYLKDTGSTYEAFLKENNLENESEEKVIQAKIQTVNEGIEIMGQDDFFKNYLGESEYKEYKSKGF